MLPEINEPEIEFMKPKADPYSYYVGKVIEVRQTDRGMEGVYRGLTTNYQVVLNPHLSFSSNLKGDSSLARWMDEPCFVSYSHIVSVTPQKESDIKKIIEKNNSFIDGETTHPACLI